MVSEIVLAEAIVEGKYSAFLYRLTQQFKQKHLEFNCYNIYLHRSLFMRPSGTLLMTLLVDSVMVYCVGHLQVITSVRKDSTSVTLIQTLFTIYNILKRSRTKSYIIKFLCLFYQVFICLSIMYLHKCLVFTC